MQISKRAPGFPIMLPMTHWFLIEQHMAWLRAMDAVTADMEEVFAVLPRTEISPDQMANAIKTGYSQLINWYGSSKPMLQRSKTVRFRAGQVSAAVDLFRVVAAFHVGGQLGETLLTRAKKLESISELDLLADASR